MSSELELLEQRIADLEADYDDLRDEYDELEAENTKIKKKMPSLNGL
jgi:chromosome segregation ATPase